MADQPQYTNRLIKEKSPYLLQHAHNPVDWYPWGDEAFLAAKDQEKPIFLSIGYATCHWCHTMETESFENLEVAQLLNDTFINIKVDREELPEVDNLYMEFAQSMMAGAAGWPLHVVLTPELKPFFAATYLPPRATEGMMGLIDLILRIKEVWRSEEKEKVVSQADKIVEVFQDSIHTKGDELPRKETIELMIELMYRSADPMYGGMKGVPKFPVGYQANLLLLYSSIANDSRALFIVERTLDMMHRGGIYDHLGGGFSRYSVDEQWLIPHFEKMLYDNALLLHAYLEAWKLTKRELYQEVSEDIIQYILRDMTHPEGAFFSAQDADSEGREGLFYTWTQGEVKDILDEEHSRLCCDFFGMTTEGNFEGRNVLHTQERIEEYASEKGLDPLELESQMTEIKHRLWTARRQRVHPLKDDKILTGWNGIMIFSLVEAGAALQIPSYIEAGTRAARFIRENLWEDGQLLRRWREGEAHYYAGLNEYAFMIRACLTLFEVGSGTEWLRWAVEMTDLLTEKYKVKDGGFYQTDGEDSSLILRRCQFADEAEPSGNAIHCENLLRLHQLTCQSRYLIEAEDVLRAVESYLETYSFGYSYHLLNLIRYYHCKTPTIVISLNKQKDFEKEIHQKIFSSYIPNRAVIWRNEDDKQLFSVLPFVKEQIPQDEKTTVYICHDRVCDRPLTDINEIKQALS